MAKISVDISANVTGTAAVDEFAKSVEDAQKSVSEFAQSQVSQSLQGVADALKEFATNAMKASEAFGAMSGAQLPQAQAASSPQTQGQSANQLQQTIDNAINRLSQATEAGGSKAAKEWSATIRTVQAQLAKMQTPEGKSAKDDAVALSSQAKATIKDSTRTLEDRLEWLTDAIDKARDKLDEAVEAQDSLATQSWGDTTAELEMQRDRLKAEQAAQESKSTGASGGADKLASYFLSQGIGQAAGLVFQGMNIGSSYRMDMANGNYLGAGVNVERGVGNIVSQTSQVVGGIMSMFLPAWAGAIVSGVGSVVGGGLNADANRRDADIAEGQRYQQLFAPKYGTARLYGGAIGNTNYSGILKKADHTDAEGNLVWEDTTVEDNATWANELVNRAELKARGTGLSITDFMNASQTYAAAGVTDADTAFKLTRDAANWTKSTGASMDSLMRLQSLGAQYGLGDNVIRTAYGGLKASGMERGQFDEFLSGLQQVIENGIANGFVKSAEDVASELSLFARLSGNNPLWQGQNGVNTLMQLNQGLAGATAMQTPEQVAAVSAAKDVYERYVAEYSTKEGFDAAKQKYIEDMAKEGKVLTDEQKAAISVNDLLSHNLGITATGGWTDYMKLLTTGNAETKWEVLQNMYTNFGGDSNAGEMAIKNLFGVDENKAAQIWKMIAENAGKSWSSLLDATKGDIEAMGGIRLDEETEQTQWQDALNGIEQAMNEYTKTQFANALVQLEKIEENTRQKAAEKTAEKTHEELVKKSKKAQQEQNATTPLSEDEIQDLLKAGKYEKAGDAIANNLFRPIQNPLSSEGGVLYNVLNKAAEREADRLGIKRKDRKDFREDLGSYVTQVFVKGDATDELDSMVLTAMAKNADVDKNNKLSNEEIFAYLVKVYTAQTAVEKTNGRGITKEELEDVLSKITLTQEDVR